MVARRNPREPKPIPITESGFRADPSAALFAAALGLRVEVRREGRPIAVLLSIDDFRDLTDPAAAAMASIPRLRHRSQRED